MRRTNGDENNGRELEYEVPSAFGVHRNDELEKQQSSQRSRASAASEAIRGLTPGWKSVIIRVAWEKFVLDRVTETAINNGKDSKMDQIGKFTIGLYYVVMVGGEPTVKLRIVHSESGIYYRDAKAQADKHREYVRVHYPDHHYDYEWQANSIVIS